MLLLIVASAGQSLAIVLRQESMRPAIAGSVAASLDVLSFNVSATNPNGEAIADDMIASLPDIAIIMEAAAIQPYLDRLSAAFPVRIGCETPATCDLSVFSRLPLAEAQVHLLAPSRRARLVSARLVIGGQRVTLLAGHLSKPYFDETAWSELNRLRALLRKVEGPVILAGDFNAAPWSGDVARFVERTGLVPPP